MMLFICLIMTVAGQKPYPYSSYRPRTVEGLEEDLTRQAGQEHYSYPKEIMDKVHKLLEKYPIIDGHNDLPFSIRLRYNNDVWKFPFDKNLTKEKAMEGIFADHTDLPRLRKGHIGAQFWAAFIYCNSSDKDGVQVVQEQMDVVHLLARKYPNDLMFAQSVRWGSSRSRCRLEQ